MTTSKNLTPEAIDFIDENQHTYFKTPDDYIYYIFRETNLSDAVYMLNKLDKLIRDYTLTQDKLNIIGDADEVFVDIEEYFSLRDFEGQIFED